MVRAIALVLVCVETACVTRAGVGPVTSPIAAAGFVRLGECEVAPDRAFDALHVSGAPAVRQLVLVVPRGQLDVRELSVSFTDGRVFVPRVRRSFAAGTASRVIDVPAGPRDLDEVIVDYGPHSRDAHVELWAR